MASKTVEDVLFPGIASRVHSSYQRTLGRTAVRLTSGRGPTPGPQVFLRPRELFPQDVRRAGRRADRTAPPSDRTSETFAAWPGRHPGAEIICRDRATACTKAVKEAAPDALEVADRWHLLQNLSAAVEKTCHQHRNCLREHTCHATATRTFTGSWRRGGRSARSPAGWTSTARPCAASATPTSTSCSSPSATGGPTASWNGSWRSVSTATSGAARSSASASPPCARGPPNRSGPTSPARARSPHGSCVRVARSPTARRSGCFRSGSPALTTDERIRRLPPPGPRRGHRRRVRTLKRAM
ncbi:transposase [Streptomyces sp. GMR22]|nr:transposase [Streptomyces sp. GMR22]